MENNWKEEMYEIITHNETSECHLKLVYLVESLLAEQKKELLDLVEKEVEKEKNKKYKCEIHNKPMGLTANYYDCTDIHIGRAEALSDISTIINNLRPIKEIGEKV